MGVFGTLVQGALGGFPTIPDAPAAPFVDPQSAQAVSITGNQRALPELKRLGSSVNQYNLAERVKMLTAGIPNYQGIVEAGGDALAAQLRGEIPEDVSRQVMRQANAQAFEGGYSGSGMSKALTARDLGRTSFDIQRSGQAALPAYLGVMNSLLPQQFNVQSGFLSPGEQITSQQWNETNRFSRDWLQAQLDSIPDPEQAALAESVGGITDLVATAALAWAGGGIGGAIGEGGGAMMGGQLGGMLGGGQNESSANIGAMFGGMWQPTPATMPATSYRSPYAQVSPLGRSTYDPWMLGGYNF